jgi:hypothetical protein
MHSGEFQYYRKTEQSPSFFEMVLKDPSLHQVGDASQEKESYNKYRQDV